MRSHQRKVWLPLSSIRDCLATEMGVSSLQVGLILSNLPREPQRRKLRWDQPTALVMNGRLKLATSREAAGEPLHWQDPVVLAFFRRRLGIAEMPFRPRRAAKRLGSRRKRARVFSSRTPLHEVELAN